MLKVHKTGIKYYNKNNTCATRESERTRARNRKRKSKRKERPVVANYITRASALYARATKGRSYRVWRQRAMWSVKKKFVPARTIRIKSVFCRRFPRVSCAPLLIKPRPGGKFLLCGRKVCLIDSVGSAVLRRLYARTRRIADELF